MRLPRSLTFSAAITALATPALAAIPPSHLSEQPRLEVATGAPERGSHAVQWTVPFAAASAWAQWTADAGGEWRALWDADTAVPSRIYGSGIAVPGSMRSAASAAEAAYRALSKHIDLLAPGASVESFELVTNQVFGGMRTVGFEQRHDGLEVIGGQLSFRFKNDRLFVVASEALPHVRIEPVRRAVDAATAKRNAGKWIVDSFGSTVTIGEREGPFVLPLLRRGGQVDYPVVVRVVVNANNPIGKWNVYLDARDGAPIAREQTLMFADGTIEYNTPVRHPGDTRVNVAAAHASAIVEGVTVASSATGELTWTGTVATDVQIGVVGTYVRVINDAGAELTAEFSLAPGATHTIDLRDDEMPDAQIISYVAANRAKDRARLLAPGMRWLDEDQIQTTVNMNGNCNAFSDGDSINFFRASSRCENTGRLPDVVYHEFGHSFHAHALIRGVGRFDTSLSEGASDYFSADITGDPGMGRGFFRSNQALRHLDDPSDERVWPDDIGEPHQTGIIFGGAMWDLRKALSLELGEADGVAMTNDIFFQILQRASDVPSTYVEALSADDDDGDLSNGTPNYCQIVDAFGQHGLADPTTAGPGIEPPHLDQSKVSVPFSQSVDCPGTSIAEAKLEWRLRRDHQVAGTVTMTEEPGKYEGRIPQQEAGEVVQYKVVVTLQNGEQVEYPENPADTYYETFVGEVIPLYCTDFEADPEVEGWVHLLERGNDQEGADDWQWGSPNGTSGSGDPAAAYSGTRVIGNDLGGGRYNGTYQPNKTNVMVSPVISTMGHTNVRLQYRRWLNVENGFFDQAQVLSNDQVVWQNLDDGDRGDRHHTDKEWRYSDVDLSSTINDAGTVQLRFKLTTDGGFESGGWTIDDVCVVAFSTNPGPRCGDGNVDTGETCDDGNGVDGDGCNSDCTMPGSAASCGNGVLDAAEACDPSVSGVTNCAADCSGLLDPAAGGNKLGGAGDLKEAEEAGCGCATTRGSRSRHGALLLLGLAGLLVLRRRGFGPPL